MNNPWNESSSPDEDALRRILRDPGTPEPPIAAGTETLLGQGRRAFRRHRVRQVGAGSGAALAFGAFAFAAVAVLPGSNAPEQSIQPADGGVDAPPTIPGPAVPTAAPRPGTVPAEEATSVATPGPSGMPTSWPTEAPHPTAVPAPAEDSQPGVPGTEPVPSAVPSEATPSAATPTRAPQPAAAQAAPAPAGVAAPAPSAAPAQAVPSEARPTAAPVAPRPTSAPAQR